jgi:flagellar hook-associated protein 2
MGSTSNAIFTGSSQFASDLQNVVARAVKIASMPINLLTTQKTDLTNQSTALGTLDSQVAALQRSAQGIQNAMGGSSFQASISNPSLVSANLSNGVLEGNYSIEVQDIGAYASGMTSSAWSAAPGAAHTYQLYTGDGTVETDITPADNSAASVAAAINAQAGDKVRAIVINVGSQGSPDLRISLQATSLGQQTLNLKDGGTNLLTPTPNGSLAQYVVNGSGHVVTSTSRSVSISDGLSVNLLGSSPGNPVNITVTRSSSALSDALSAFANAYNTVVTSLDQQRGQGQGVLGGQSVIYDISDALRGMITYIGGGSVNSLASLGLDLGLDGKLTFDPLSLASTDIGNSSGVTAFLGSADTGGFLKTAIDTMTRLEDASTGIVKTAETSLSSQITALTTEISDKQAKVDQMQQDLTDRMANADAMIASMEQQYSYITGMFQAMQVADQQYK